MFLGLALLLGGGFARHWCSPGTPRLRWLGAGLALLFVGAGLSIYSPLSELGGVRLADLLGYLTQVTAGQAAVLLLLGATLFFVAEIHRLPALVLAGVGLCALWGLAGIGHGGIHGGTVRGLHALHAGAMAVWIGGLGSQLLAPSGDRLAGLRQFSPVAAGCAAVIVLTGLGMSLEHVPSVAALQQSDYGRALVAKLLVFSGVLLTAASVRQAIRGQAPRLRLWLEFTLLLTVLALTARLGGLPMAH